MYLTDKEMTRMVESVIEELEYRGISYCMKKVSLIV